MKKMLLIGMLILGSLAYSNDGDFKGKDNQEINRVSEEKANVDVDIQREETPQEKKFEMEMDHEDRGHESN